MPDTPAGPWPWYVAGPLIGLLVPVLLLAGNRLFGFSSNFRHLCAAVSPARPEYLRYDWRSVGGWNLAFLVGTLAGAFLSTRLLGLPAMDLAADTRMALEGMGVHDAGRFVPAALLSWEALRTLPGLVAMVAGGFLVGFGTAWAGGCTSGHAVTGLATFRPASLVAVLGFFAGGLLGAHLLLPWLLR